MKKIIAILTILLLTACANNGAPQITSESQLTTEDAESQATGFPGAEAGTATPNSVGGLGRGSFLFDLPVQNVDGDAIAVIDDVVINLQTRYVDFLILSLGADGRQVVVPWSAVNANMRMSLPEDETSYHFSLQTEQGTVEASPDFQSSEMPAFGDPTTGWDAQWRGYWEMGETPTSNATATVAATAEAQPAGTATVLPSAPLSGVVLMSELIGMNVQTSDGQSAGVIEEVLINSSGAVSFVVLATNNSDGEPVLVAVPLQALGWNETNGSLVLNADKAALDGAPTFAGGEYPSTEASGWDSEVSTYWSGY